MNPYFDNDILDRSKEKLHPNNNNNTIRKAILPSNTHIKRIDNNLPDPAKELTNMVVLT